ncbi:MAG: TOMM precursor leader peptide-binding protein, partial [Crocosphaera sp.]
VFFISERESVCLQDPLYYRLVQLIDGQRNVDEIIDILQLELLQNQELIQELPNFFQEVLNFSLKIQQALFQLHKQGYLLEKQELLPSNLAIFCHHLNISQSQAYHQLQSTKVAVKTLGTVAAVRLEELISILKSFHIKIADEGDLTIILTDDYLHRNLEEFNQQALASQKTWMLVKPLGTITWIGPLFTPYKTGCWHCFAQRLRDNRPIEEFIFRQKSKTILDKIEANKTKLNQIEIEQKNINKTEFKTRDINNIEIDKLEINPIEINQTEVNFREFYLKKVEQIEVNSRELLTPPLGFCEATIQTTLTQAATEVFKWIIQKSNPRIEGNLITYDTLTLQTQDHVLVKRPQCPSCGQVFNQSPLPVVLGHRKKAFTSDGGHRFCSPEETLRKYQHHISPITGIVRELVKIPSQGLIHTYVAKHHFRNVFDNLDGLRQNIGGRSSGKGRTDSQAKASGFCEAIERYSGVFQGDEIREKASYQQFIKTANNEQVKESISEQQLEEKASYQQFIKTTNNEPIKESISEQSSGVKQVRREQLEIRSKAYSLDNQNSYQKLGYKAIHPNLCMQFSEQQYQTREEWNANCKGWFQKVPEPFDETRVIDWTPVWSLTEQEFKYLPTAYCYYGYPQSDFLDCWADSNGCAAGNTIEEAILQGFMELVERDCVALWWYNRLSKPQVDLDSFNELYVQNLQQFNQPNYKVSEQLNKVYCQNFIQLNGLYFQQLKQYYNSLNRDLWVLDITSDLNIPCFAAISARKDREVEDIILGYGAHFDPKIAISRALTEVNQILPNVLSFKADGTTNYPPSADPLVLKWWQTATLTNQSYLVPNNQLNVKKSCDYLQLASDDLLDDVKLCQKIVEEKGMELLVLDQTRPDIGLRVAKVIVPGMRHMWKRLGAGRLYEVPVKMGWLKEALTEDELNPFPMWM